MQVHTQNFSPGGGDHETVHNLCLILKIMLHKSCLKYNNYITLFATAFVYIQI